MAKINNNNKDEESNGVDENKEESNGSNNLGPSKGILLMDLILRFIAAISILGSSIAMRPNNQKYYFSSHLLLSFMPAEYNNLPTFMFFFVTNAIVCCYLVLSLVLSILHIFMRKARITRVILITCDTVMVILLTSGASAAAALVQLAYQGNARADWEAICHENTSFCGRVTGSLVGSFIGVVVLVLLVFFTSIALSRC